MPQAIRKGEERCCGESALIRSWEQEEEPQPASPPRSHGSSSPECCLVALLALSGQGAAGGGIVFKNEIHDGTTLYVTCRGAGRAGPLNQPVAYHASITLDAPPFARPGAPVCTATFTDQSGSPKAVTVYSFDRDRRRCQRRCVLVAQPDALYSAEFLEKYRPDNATDHDC